jgi:hypothetical protein
VGFNATKKEGQSNCGISGQGSLKTWVGFNATKPRASPNVDRVLKNLGRVQRYKKRPSPTVE